MGAGNALPVAFAERLRREPARASVPESLPVLFFGHLETARVATIGLNPSDQEYLDAEGRLLTGKAQRFATLSSLGSGSRSALTALQCETALTFMRLYFEPGKPVYGAYFRTLTRFLNGFGASWHDGTAVHLDLVQEATVPRWSALPRPTRSQLLESDLPFLLHELRAFSIDTVVCTGATVSRHVRALLGVEQRTTGRLALVEWWVGQAAIGSRSVRVVGWNRPLHQPTGLGAIGEARLGALLSST